MRWGHIFLQNWFQIFCNFQTTNKSIGCLKKVCLTKAFGGCLFVFKFIYLFILLIPHLLCFCFQERDYLPESSYSLPPNEYYDNPLYSHPTKVGHSALGVYPDYLPKTPSTLYPYGYRAKEGSLDRLHETASSRSRSRKTARIVWTLVAVVFVTAIVAGTAVIIYLTSQCKFTPYSNIYVKEATQQINHQIEIP